MNIDDVAERDVALLDAGADTAAVYECDICSGLITVSICTKVSEVGLGNSDDTDRMSLCIYSLRIIDRKVYIRNCNYFIELVAKLGILGCNFLSHVIIYIKEFISRHTVVP